MWNDLKVSLYDLFGFFFPGAIFSLAFVLLTWSIFFPKVTQFSPNFKTTTWTIVILIAYLAGHVVQAIANRIFPSKKSIERSMNDESMSKEFIDLARKEARTLLYGPGRVDIKDIHLYRICDEILCQKGKPETRSIYEYREGFYRGLSISFFLLALAPLPRVVISGATVWLNTIPISWKLLLFMQIISFVISVLFYFRYRRFSDYKIREAILGFLVFQKAKDKSASVLDDWC
jgi:hypothetical protein